MMWRVVKLTRHLELGREKPSRNFTRICVLIDGQLQMCRQILRGPWSRIRSGRWGTRGGAMEIRNHARRFERQPRSIGLPRTARGRNSRTEIHPGFPLLSPYSDEQSHADRRSHYPRGKLPEPGFHSSSGDSHVIHTVIHPVDIQQWDSHGIHTGRMPGTADDPALDGTPAVGTATLFARGGGCRPSRFGNLISTRARQPVRSGAEIG